MSCAECFSGHVSSSNPAGKTDTVYNRQTYIAEPSNPTAIKGIIVIVPDAFGWKFVNNRLLADHYANLGGFKVYLPDFMDDTAAPIWMIDVFAKLLKTNKRTLEYFQLPYYAVLAMRGFLPFFVRNRPSVSMPKVREFFEALRDSEERNLPVGAAGFCWGGLHVLKLAADMATTEGRPLVDAAFTAHPSDVDIPNDFKNIQKPTSLAIGNKDVMLPPGKIEKVKEIWNGLHDIDTQVVEYPGAGHGFAVRADPLNVKQAEQSTEAEVQAITWFEKHFSSVGG